MTLQLRLHSIGRRADHYAAQASPDVAPASNPNGAERRACASCHPQRVPQTLTSSAVAFEDSLWHDTAGGPFAPRPPLAGDIEADVAIVGGGYTGLWTAYYLRALDPN